MNIISCPKCGEIKQYGYLEKVSRYLLFNADGEPCGSTEDDMIYTGTVPRCIICMSKVIIKEADKEAEE